MTLPFLAIKLVKPITFLLCIISHTSNLDLQNSRSHSGAQHSLLAISSDHLTLRHHSLGSMLVMFGCVCPRLAHVMFFNALLF